MLIIIEYYCIKKTLKQKFVTITVLNEIFSIILHSVKTCHTKLWQESCKTNIQIRLWNLWKNEWHIVTIQL